MNKLALTSGMSAALPIVYRLEQEGHETVFVGGAVRDAVLGIKVKDVDIATAAKPEEVMGLFPRCIPTGLAHGTVTVMHEGVPYEVTTFRQESAYMDHRKPSAVTFVNDLDGDLLRRDFTVNAMAVRGDGTIHDPFGGLADLQRGILRCVGDANERFREDSLRMVRAVRFIGSYGFRPAASAWRSLLRHRELLRHVAMERIHAELDKMIEGGDPGRALAWLHACGLLRYTKEPLAFVAAINKPSDRTCNPGAMKAISEPDVRWAQLAIASDVDSENMRSTLETLRMSNKRIKRIVPIIALSESIKDWLSNEGCDNRKAATKDADEAFMALALTHGVAAALDWLRIERLLAYEDSSDKGVSGMLLDRFERLLADAPLLAHKELNVNGAELAGALGKEAGPWLKPCLDKLLLESALGRIVNRKDILIQAAMSWLQDKGNDKA